MSNNKSVTLPDSKKLAELFRNVKAESNQQQEIFDYIIHQIIEERAFQEVSALTAVGIVRTSMHEFLQNNTLNPDRYNETQMLAQIGPILKVLSLGDNKFLSEIKSVYEKHLLMQGWGHEQVDYIISLM